MSRNGSGVYSKPAGSTATTGQTILASEHNTPIDDLEADANIARPVVAGGTGEVSVANTQSSFGIADKTSTATISGVWTHSANQIYNDNVKALFGTGSDCGIYFDGTDTFIDADAGDVEVTLTAGNNFRIKQDNGETVASFFTDGGILLYHNNSNKISTSAIGATITGSVLSDNTAKCFVRFNGAGTAATVGSPHNVTSLTDNGTGDYTITIATDMADADYVVSAHVSESATGGFGGLPDSIRVVDRLAGSFTINTSDPTSSSDSTIVAEDKSIIDVVVYGD